MEQERIRNFAIIAHIDHGKSTLADRILELTGAVSERDMREQMLDSMELERERGITIKAQAVRVAWRGHQLNLIDTPGHVDFTYEVSRSLQACEGALLVVDAAQGIEAQTLANAYLAIEKSSRSSRPRTRSTSRRRIPTAPRAELGELLGEDARARPADLGEDRRGVAGGARRHRRAHPAARRRARRACTRPRLRLVVRPVPRRRRVRPRRGRELRDAASRCVRWRRARRSRPRSSESCRPPAGPSSALSAGEVGYVMTGLKDVSRLRVGDTLTSRRRPASERLPGYQDVKPMVFAGIFPTDSDDYPELRDALERLKLNDGSLSYEPETSQALGFGFRCGFLGLLHMEIVRERLEREFDLDLLITAPNVAYRGDDANGRGGRGAQPGGNAPGARGGRGAVREGVGDRPEGLRRRRHGAREREARELRPSRVPERGACAAHLRAAVGRDRPRLLRPVEVADARVRELRLRPRRLPRPAI